MSDDESDSDDEEPILGELLATERVTTTGRQLATALASGAVGILVGMFTIPRRALDVPTEQFGTIDGQPIFEAVYYPVDTGTVVTCLGLLGAAVLLWHVFDADGETVSDEEPALGAVKDAYLGGEMDEDEMERAMELAEQDEWHAAEAREFDALVAGEGSPYLDVDDTDDGREERVMER